MKYIKLFILLSMIAIAVIGITIFSLRGNPDTNGVQTVTPSVITSRPKPVSPVATSNSVSTAVIPTEQTPHTVASPSPEENKLKLEQLITNTAVSHGLTGIQLEAQWACIDKIIGDENITYDDYSVLLNAPIVQFYLQPFHSADGTTIGYRYFDYRTTCSLYTNPRF